jgi:Tfp pilus assembly protein PilZ
LLKNKKKNILLNFDKVDIVDYSGVSILAIAYQNVINNKGKIKFCNVPLPVDELFRLVRLDSIFEVYGDEKGALKTFCFESTIDRKLLRRRFKRLDTHIEIEFCLKKEYGNKNKIWHVGKLFNLSGDGIFLYGKKVLSVGKEVILRIDLRNKRPIEIKGEIIWVADKKLQPQSYPGMGICFKNISKRDQDKILEFINKHITHRSAML